MFCFIKTVIDKGYVEIFYRMKSFILSLLYLNKLKRIIPTCKKIINKTVQAKKCIALYNSKVKYILLYCCRDKHDEIFFHEFLDLHLFPPVFYISIYIILYYYDNI